MKSLNDPTLFKNQAYLNGSWSDALNANTFAVRNPYDMEILTHVPDMDESDAALAIEAAREAFSTWKLTTAGKRARLLKNWYDLIREHEEDLAMLLTLEQGKPLREARGEVRYGAAFVEWFAEEARRVYGDVIPAHARGMRLMAIKQPVGVVAAITPWNFPNAMITRKIAPALAAGCTVVVKPAEDTPLSALALAELAERAGFPAGVINIVTTNQPEEVGGMLTSHPDVRKVSFTGSTAVGKIIMQQCATTLKKISLELGGNAPFIVFEDADLEKAAAGAIASKYRNAGQTCICSNRIYVQESIKEEFLHHFTKAVKGLKVGSGQENHADVGPLINEAALDKVTRLVDEAVQGGASVITGGSVFEQDAAGYFFAPTVLTDLSPEMSIYREEIFGPVAPVYSFTTEEEVIEMANNTTYGLAAYFYGRDYARIWRVAEGLEYGMVGVNTGMISTPVAPFGGVKESGIGREGSKYGIDEFVEIKYLCFGGMS